MALKPTFDVPGAEAEAWKRKYAKPSPVLVLFMGILVGLALPMLLRSPTLVEALGYLTFGIICIGCARRGIGFIPVFVIFLFHLLSRRRIIYRNWELSIMDIQISATNMVLAFSLVTLAFILMLVRKTKEVQK